MACFIRLAAALWHVLLVYFVTTNSMAQLTADFYDKTCPKVSSIVQGVVQEAVRQEARMAASLLRLHFHDCFVNGCDGSVLLDDTSTFIGEKTAPPNNNSLRGFDVVDKIKSAVDAACKATVSCADILALAAEAAVVSVGGPSWTVLLGRRDSTTAHFSAAKQDLPSPIAPLSGLVNKFQAVGLSTTDMVTLSGGHTIGRARCLVFSFRLYNFTNGSADPTIDSSYLKTLQGVCPQAGGSPNALAALDVRTQDKFDNDYFKNLEGKKGLLLSDEELFTTGAGSSGSTASSLVRAYSKSQSAFFNAFAKSMVNMGNIKPLTGSKGEIRLNCRKVNS